VGDGEQGTEPDAVNTRLREINDFRSVLERALTEHDSVVAALTADTLDRELRELTELIPDTRSSAVTGGLEARAQARSVLKNLVLAFRRIAVASRDAQFEEAITELTASRKLMGEAVTSLTAAEPWSLLNRDIHDAHFTQLKQLYRAAIDPLNPPRRLDLD
jgi:hypothetical protein